MKTGATALNAWPAADRCRILCGSDAVELACVRMGIVCGLGYEPWPGPEKIVCRSSGKVYSVALSRDKSKF